MGKVLQKCRELSCVEREMNGQRESPCLTTSLEFGLERVYAREDGRYGHGKDTGGDGKDFETFWA
jgi:hypothetical protein